jgi:putative NADH-flavin reductase
MPRFLILGGTGSSGILLVRKALELYPDATFVVYARSPEKVPEDLANNASVTLIKGTLEELDKAEAAVQDVDAVISALGPLATHPSNTPIATFYGHLIDYMNKYNVKRLIVLGTASSKDPNDKFSLQFQAMIIGVRTFANAAYRDIVAIGNIMRTKGTDLDWTIVRVPILTNADTEGVIAGYVGDGKIGTILSRKAFAAFAIGEIEKREWVQKAPMISNA